LEVLRNARGREKPDGRESARDLARHLSPSVDLEAVGAILFECLTGKKPWDCCDIDSGERSNRIDYYLRSFELPPRLILGIARSLSKDPAGRYSRAEEFFRELKAISNEKVEKRPTICSSPDDLAKKAAPQGLGRTRTKTLKKRRLGVLKRRSRSGPTLIDIILGALFAYLLYLGARKYMPELFGSVEHEMHEYSSQQK
jgi:serine/threonine protein kinase